MTKKEAAFIKKSYTGIVTKKLPKGFEMLEYFKNYTSLDIDGYVAKKDDEMLIVLKETDSDIDIWQVEAKFWRTHGVHAGIYNVARKIFSVIKNHLLQNHNKKYKIIGFSLGGALAQALSYIITKHTFTDHQLDIECVTLASPRVFSSFVVSKLEATNTDIKNYIYQNDFVTKLPFWWLGYKHYRPIILGKRDWWIYSIEDHNFLSYIDALSRTR